jgi:hypothetical protein
MGVTKVDLCAVPSLSLVFMRKRKWASKKFPIPAWPILTAT